MRLRVSVSFAAIAASCFFTTFAAEAGVNPNAYWMFDETTGTAAVDSSGNGNTGTIVGASRTMGKFGKCVVFQCDSNDMRPTVNPEGVIGATTSPMP